MIYTFLYGIDSIFRINKSLWLFTSLYFLFWVVSVLGWNFLRRNNSFVKTCLGFVFVPAFPLFISLFSYGSIFGEFHKEYFFIFGGIYFFVLALSLVLIGIKTKDSSGNKSGIQMVFIILSGMMFFAHSCIELIPNFENFAGNDFVYLSIIPIVYFYLKVLIVRLNNNEDAKLKKMNSISNVLFWLHIVLTDFAVFVMAAASV